MDYHLTRIDILISRIMSPLDDLREKNKQSPNREKSLAITKLEEAIFWLSVAEKRELLKGTDVA